MGKVRAWPAKRPRGLILRKMANFMKTKNQNLTKFIKMDSLTSKT